MSKSLKSLLYKYLREHPNRWFHKGELGHAAESYGYMAETGGRCLRKMIEIKMNGLEDKEEPTKSGHPTKYYRYVESPYQVMHKTFQATNDVKNLTLAI